MNLSSQKDRVAELERELQDLKQPGTGEPERTEVRSGDRLRVHELEIERASLKQELSVRLLLVFYGLEESKECNGVTSPISETPFSNIAKKEPAF